MDVVPPALGDEQYLSWLQCDLPWLTVCTPVIFDACIHLLHVQLRGVAQDMWGAEGLRTQATASGLLGTRHLHGVREVHKPSPL